MEKRRVASETMTRKVYAVQTKIGYELNDEVSPCVIATNYKEPISVVKIES